MQLINPTEPKYALTLNGSYLLEKKDICSSVKHLKMLILILSAATNFQKRDIIRETWGNTSSYSQYGIVKLLFLLGKSVDTDIQRNIREEFKRHADILQGQVIDSYQNLSHKTVLGLKWLNERCRNSEFILKTDDDIVVNMFLVFQNVLLDIAVDKYHVHCDHLKTSRIFRLKTYKNAVEPHQFRGVKYHMPYCQGNYVLLLNDIVPSLYRAASITPFFWIDDVFSYGIIMSNIPSLKYKRIKSDEHISYSKLTRLPCWKQILPACCHIFINSGNDYETRDVWSKIMKQYQDFSNKTLNYC
jgi:beta-1,3-galactosyltransferase 1